MHFIPVGVNPFRPAHETFKRGSDTHGHHGRTPYIGQLFRQMPVNPTDLRSVKYP